MSLDTDFQADPETFLKTHVIMVPEDTDHWCDEPGAYQFTLEKSDRNLVLLKPRIKITGDFIYAYYLPWELNKATTMQLGAKADFFFTSEMTNCRFSVLMDDPKSPQVAHVAGNTNKKLRDQYESTSGFVNDESTKRARRLSISDSAKGIAKHGYKGQKGPFSTSAFTFGQRDKDGKWKFSAQVTKGVLSSVPTLTEDLQILGYVDVLNL